MNKSLIHLLLLFMAVQLPAQPKSLQRRYVPIVIKRSLLPVARFNSTEWRAVRYQAGQWKLAPFQVDSVKADGRYQYTWKGGETSNNDELLFMPEDLGDRAPDNVWYDDPGGRSSTRLEFEFSEWLESDKKGWIYLYRSNQTPKGYFTMPESSQIDTITTPSYRLGHNRDGWIDFISLANNPQLDLIDRFKLRIAGASIWVPALKTYVMVEDTLNEGEHSAYIHPIRTFRNQKNRLVIPQIVSEKGSYPYSYFPYSVKLDVQNEPMNLTLIGLAGILTLRQSLDLSPAARNMRFYSEKNRDGLIVDGVAETVDEKLQVQTGKHWFMASGEQGTLFLIMEMPNLINGTSYLYYRDDAGGGTNDKTPDSGDGKSYGDMGLWAKANNAEGLGTKYLTMGVTLYMLSEHSRNAAFADSLFTWIQQPLKADVIEQTAPAAGVTMDEKQPIHFALSSTWPNPVLAGHGSAQWRLTTLRPNQHGEIRIYNTLGQVIRSWPLTSAGNGSERLVWDLSDLEGRTVAPGVYYMQVQLDGVVETRSVQVLR